MKKILFCLLLFISVLSFSQKNDSIVLQKGIWISGVEGGISNARELGSIGNNVGKNVDYQFNLNSGMFFNSNWAIGLEFDLNKKGEERATYSSNFERLHVGPWVRYFIQMQYNWFVYPELGVSYANYFSTTYQSNNIDYIELHGSGVGVSPGIGIVYFVSKTAAFNVKWGYQWSLLRGDYREEIGGALSEESVSSVQIGTSSIMFGFQLYLHEFFF